jgi:hypothetical protein
MNLLRHAWKKRNRNTIKWKSPLQWILNDDSDCFTSLNSFLVTGYVNGCPIHYFKFLKSMNILRHTWSKRNRNKGW